NLTKHQLIELDACTRCGECIKWCPVTALPEYKNNTPMDKIAEYRAFVQNEHGWRSRIIKPRPIPKERLDAFADAVYKCTTCGRCGVVCPVGIHCQELWPSIRANLVDLGYGPIESINEARRILEDKHNPFDLPYDERNNWIPKDFDNPQNADLAFFVGCELAYRTEPMATGALKVLKAAGVQFTLLEDEWCCGFPLYVLGDRGEEFKAEIEHNIEQLRNKGVKKVVPSCPC
ncbi:MAG: (Fe-S)-binding protein, partial [Candidatus Hydrothermarchaeaceae archaeon]